MASKEGVTSIGFGFGSSSGIGNSNVAGTVNLTGGMQIKKKIKIDNNSAIPAVPSAVANGQMGKEVVKEVVEEVVVDVVVGQKRSLDI